MQAQLPLLFTALLAFPSNAQAQSWETTVVAEHSGLQPNLGIDPLGNLHLTWYTSNSVDAQMHYATNQSGGWDYFRPFYDTNSDYWSPVVEGDSHGCFHITVRGDAGDAHYWTNNPDKWTEADTRVPLDTPYDISCHGHHVNIEVASDDTPQIFRECDGRIFHQTNTQQIFNDYTTSDPDHNSSVIHQWTTAMEDDVLHAAVRLTPTGIAEATIFYTTKEPGSYTDHPWSPVEEVHAGGWPSITTRDGVPHLVYSYGHNMHYTTRSGDAWSTPENIGGSDDPAHTGIAIDDNGFVHTVWVESSGGIYYTNNIGGSWLEPSLAGTTGSRDWEETHMDDKLALDTKANTIFIVYSNGDQVLMAHTSDISLRDETAGGSSTIQADSDFTPPTEITQNNASAARPLELLRFSVTDAGDDGLPTEIGSIFFQAGPEQYFDDIKSSWYFKEGMNSFVASASIVPDSSSISRMDIETDWILDNKLVFSAESGALFSVADGATESFSLQLQAHPLNEYWEDRVLDLVLRGSYDIQTLDTGSAMAYDQPILATGPMAYHYEALDTGIDTGSPDTGPNDTNSNDTGPEDSGGDDSGSAQSEETGDPQDGEAKQEDGGCSCTQGTGPGGWWPLLLTGLVLRRRPTRP